MQCFWKAWVGVFAALAVAGGAQAVPYLAPNGQTYELEYWAGSGANEAVVEVDFAQAADDVFAFGYRWDGLATGQDAMEAIDAAGDLDITLGPWGGFFVDTLSYEGHTGINEPNFPWVPWWSYWTDDAVNPGDPIEWVWDTAVAASDRTLLNGSFDGWFFTREEYNPEGLQVPPRQPPVAQQQEETIPEPATVALLIAGLAGVASRRRRSRA
jgi:hypothetical protein